MVNLINKKVVIIGDRDGIPGLAIEECVKPIEGLEVVFSSTECFRLNSRRGYGLRKPKNVLKKLPKKFGNEKRCSFTRCI